jgi:hypothetical protein
VTGREGVQLSGLGKAERLVELYADARNDDPIESINSDKWHDYEAHLAEVVESLDALEAAREAAEGVRGWVIRCGGDLVQVPRERLDRLLDALDGKR